METQAILAQIDAEIDRLQQVRAILTGTGTNGRKNQIRCEICTEEAPALSRCARQDCGSAEGSLGKGEEDCEIVRLACLAPADNVLYHSLPIGKRPVRDVNYPTNSLGSSRTPFRAHYQVRRPYTRPKLSTARAIRDCACIRERHLTGNNGGRMPSLVRTVILRSELR
jgi:hypothetical protein